MPSALTRTRAQAGEPDLFGPADLPPGLDYAPNIIPPRDEARLMRQFEILPFRPFEFHGYLGNRRIVSYGHRYDYAARTLRAADDMPDFLSPLKDAAASRFSGLAPERFKQALVTEYAPGAGIGWHKDKPMFEDVVGFSFAVPCVLRLRRKSGSRWERKSLRIEPRSAYLLRGAVRWDWEHSIAPLNSLRYSVTLRTFV